MRGDLGQKRAIQGKNTGEKGNLDGNGDWGRIKRGLGAKKGNLGQKYERNQSI